MFTYLPMSAYWFYDYINSCLPQFVLDLRVIAHFLAFRLVGFFDDVQFLVIWWVDSVIGFVKISIWTGRNGSILFRHAMATKRKFDRTESGECSTAKRVKCNYCFKERPLASDKSYCMVCVRDVVECIKCHRPLPQRLMRDDDVLKSLQEQKRSSSDRRWRRSDHRKYIASRGSAKRCSVGFWEKRKKRLSKNSWKKLDEFDAVKMYLTIIVKLLKYDKEGEEI